MEQPLSLRHGVTLKQSRSHDKDQARPARLFDWDIKQDDTPTRPKYMRNQMIKPKLSTVSVGMWRLPS
jgi:hypothetical protein